ncbi:MAG: hypothetical protein AB9856_14290 [Cellulosilyticaceae bacterium]
MGMSINLGKDRQDIERKIRIIKSLIEADKSTNDNKSLKYHTQALVAQQEALDNLNKG